MKIKLKKSSFKAIRFIGQKAVFPFLDFNLAIGKSFKLGKLILDISGPRIVTSRIYFKILSNSEIEGPYLRITGSVNALPSNHVLTDYRDTYSYDLDLNHGELDQLDSIFDELYKTFVDFDYYIYCDSTKLGLQLFKK